MSPSAPIRRRLAAGVPLLLFLVLLADPLAAATDDGGGSAWRESPWRLELYAAVLFDDGLDEENVGARGVYDLDHRWSFETDLAHFSVGDDDFEFWLADLSARYAFDLDGPTRWYLTAGFGKTFRSLDDLDDGLFLFHAGIGQEIDLGWHLYLRPELLARWNERSLSESVGADVSIGVGWRF